MAADLEFRIGAELSEIKGALASLQRDFQKTGQAAQNAGKGADFSRMDAGIKTAVGSLGRLIAGFASLAAAIKLIGTADELETLNARLKLATNSAEEFASAQEKLFDLSQRTRSGLKDTIDLYARVAASTKEAGVGQDTLLRVVETINKAVQLSGVSAESAKAALVQLGQGLGSGVLRGEELNSVLEQTGALADAIAKGMGISRSELKAFGEQGKITSEQVVKALVKQGEAVDQQFAQLPLTVSQSVTLLQNAGLRILGTFNKISQATGGLANVIRDVATYLSSEEFLNAVTEWALLWSDAVGRFAADWNETLRIVREGTKDLVSSGEDLIDIIGRAFRELPTNIRTSIQIVAVQAFALFDKLVSYARFVKDNFTAIFTSDTQDAAFARFQARNRAIDEARQGSIDAAFAERDAALAAAKAARDRIAAERAAARNREGGKGTGTFKPKAATPEELKAIAKAEFDAAEKLSEDATKRALARLQDLYEDAGVAVADYFRRRAEIETAGIEKSIAVERERAKAGGAEKIKALAEIEILERRKGDIEIERARQTAQAKRAIEKQLEDARIRELETTGQGVEAARLKAEARYAELKNRLIAEGDQAGVDLINRAISGEIDDAKLDELRDKISRSLGNLRGGEQLIAAQQEAGQLSGVAAEQQLIDLRNQSIAQLQQYRDALLAVAEAQTANGGIADPRIAETVRELDTEIARATATQRTFQNNVKQAGTDALSGFFTDLATGARSFGDAVKAAALSFIQSLGRMAAEALAKKAILALTGPGGLLAGVLHSGGMVGAGGASRRVSPLLFAGAPRYHSGGMVGLKPDERPAILQTGEEVLSRTDPRNQANGGGSSSGYRIVNVLDPSLAANFLESSAGERTIMNIIGRNPGQVRQLIGA